MSIERSIVDANCVKNEEERDEEKRKEKNGNLLSYLPAGCTMFFNLPSTHLLSNAVFPFPSLSFFFRFMYTSQPHHFDNVFSVFSTIKKDQVEPKQHSGHNGKV